MALPSTATQAQMQARIDSLPEDSERQSVLLAAKRFKASWVELGEILLKIRDGGSYKRWGFATFEAYCRRELHIKQETANKLTRSFAYLRQHAPASLGPAVQGEQAHGPPALDVVDLLSQAQERTKVSAEALADIGQEMLSRGTAPTRTDVLKKLREQDPEAFRAGTKATATPAGPARPVAQALRKAMLLAERLSALLVGPDTAVDEATRAQMQQVTDVLRALFAANETAVDGDMDLVQSDKMN